LKFGRKKVAQERLGSLALTLAYYRPETLNNLRARPLSGNASCSLAVSHKLTAKNSSGPMISFGMKLLPEIDMKHWSKDVTFRARKATNPPRFSLSD